jgi:hypothetical protein
MEPHDDPREPASGSDQDFPRRILDAAADAGIDPATVGRHLPILRRCVPDDDAPVLVTRAQRDGDRTCYLVLLTARRLVVTAESRVLRRRRLHLHANPRLLVDVLWTAEPTMGGVALAATAVDGVREHFWLRTNAPERAAEALARVFRPATAATSAAASVAAAA